MNRAHPTTPRLVLLLLTTAAALLGLRHLSTASVVGDEAIYRAAAGDLLRGVWTDNLQHPPLAKELIALTRALLTPLGVDQLTADRTLGVVCFLLTGLLLTRIARRFALGPGPGILAAALWWFLPLSPGVLRGHVDRYALLEAPTLLWVTAAVLAALQVRERPTAGRWGLAGVCVGAATASKLTGALAAAAVVTVAVVLLIAHQDRADRRDDRRPGRLAILVGLVLAGFVAVATFLLTYLPMGTTQARHALRTVVEFQLEHAADGHPQEVAGTITAFPPWWSPWWFQAQYLGVPATVALWSLALVGTLVLFRRNRSVVVVSTTLAVVTVALATSSLKLPHYHALAVPLLDLLAAAAITLGFQARRRWQALTALALVPLVLAAGTGVARTWTMEPGDYGAAAALLRERGLATGVVVVWGDRPAAQAALPQAEIVTTPDPDCTVPALLVDDTVVRRLPAVDLPGWLTRCGPDRRSTSFPPVTVSVPADPWSRS